MNDIFKEETAPDWREAILRNAKPLDWDAMQKLLPPQTPEEQAEGEAFIALLEEERRKDRELSKERDGRFLEKPFTSLAL